MNRCARDAAALAKFKVYLVAHSMGGLICRTYLQNVTRDDTEHYVDKVCTYATPHGGIEMRGLNVPDIGALDKIQGRPGNRDVWIFEVESETLRPLARSDGDDESPIWSPDGGGVVYTSGRGEQANLHARTAGGDGAAERLSESASREWPQSWSSDGRVLVFSSRTVHPSEGPQPLDVRLMMLDEDRAVAPLLVSAFNESNPAVSPDGVWVAYRSDESGRNEVYVERFPDLGDRLRISTDGGTAPLWSHDGTELYYREGRAVMAVPVETGDSFTAGPPETLFEGPYLDDLARNYDLAPDGRFLMIKPAE